MALKIRLARGGAKKRPFYQIVIADARAPRDGRFVEKVGTYNPMLPQESQDRVHLNEERIKHWLSVGAQPTDRVAMFLGKAKLTEAPAIRPTPKKSAPKAKAQERMKIEEENRKAAAEAAAAAQAEPEPAPSDAVQQAETETVPEVTRDTSSASDTTQGETESVPEISGETPEEPAHKADAETETVPEVAS